MNIPTGFNVFTDAYIQIHFHGNTIQRTCLGVQSNVVAGLIMAMAKQPEIRDAVLQAVELWQRNPDITDKLNATHG